MKNLTIAMVLPLLVEGGIRTHLREIIPRLRAHGHKIVLLTNTKYRAFTDLATDKIHNFWTLPLPRYGLMPRALYGALRAIEDCDVIHVHAYPHFLADYLTITRHCHQKPLVITFHGSFHQFTNTKVLYLKKLHNIVMLRFAGLVDRFITVSQAEKNEALKQGIPETSVEIVYNGVSNSYAQLERLYQPNSDYKRILYLGRITSTKNLELLIQAMPYIITKIEKVKLIMAGGDWGLSRNLQKLAWQLGLADIVEFTGEITEEQKINYLLSCDVFVHPSLQDIFSLSILEAASAGLPVVAFEAGSNAEMVLDGQTGILVKPYTPQALAAAITTILTDSGLAKAMGQKAREYAPGKFSWDQTADELERIYYSITGIGKGAG